MKQWGVIDRIHVDSVSNSWVFVRFCDTTEANPGKWVYEGVD